MFDPSLDCLARGRSRGRCKGEHTDISTAQTQLATPDLSDGLGVVRMVLAPGAVAAGPSAPFVLGWLAFPGRRAPPVNQRRDNTSMRVYVFMRGGYELRAVARVFS